MAGVSQNSFLQQDRYIMLRRKLTELSYTEIFTVDSIEMVDKLLTDLLNTTASYKQVQDKENRLVSDLSLAQAQLFPLRKENARLSRENHELHLDQIHQGEKTQEDMRAFTKQIRDLGDQITELKLLNRVFEDQVKDKDNIIERLRETYESVTDPALKSKYVISSSIKASSKLSRADALIGTENNANMLQAWKDLQVQTNAQNVQLIGSLKQQLEKANSIAKSHEDEVAKLKSALAAREQELSRTSRLIGNVAAGKSNFATGAGDSVQALAIDPFSIEASNKRVIDQLNGQVDFLNEQLALREAQLSSTQFQISEYEVLKSDLALKVTALEKTKEENNRLHSRVQFLENKVVSYRSSSISALQTPKPERSTDFSSPAEFGMFSLQSPSGEYKDTLQRAGSDSNLVKIKTLEETVNMLINEKAQLEKEMLAMQRREASLSEVRPVPGSDFKSTSGGRSGASTPKGAFKENPIIIELNKEVEDLRRKNMALMKQTKELEAKVSYLQTSKSGANSKRTSPQSGGSHVSSALQEESAMVRSKLDSTERALTEMTYQFNKSEAMFSEARDQLQDKDREASDLRRSLDATMADLSIASARIKDLESRCQRDEGDVTRYFQEIKELKFQLAARGEELSRLREINAELNAMNQELPRSSSSSTAARPSQPANTIADYSNKEIELFQRENDGMRKHISQLQAEIALLNERLNTSNQRLFEGESAFEHEAGTVSVLKSQMKEQRATVEKQIEEILSLQSQNEQLKLQANTWQRQVDDSKSRKKVEEIEFKKLQKERDDAEQRVQQIKDLVTRMEANKQIASQKILSLEETINKLEMQLSSLESENLTMMKAADEKEAMYSNMRRTLESLDDERDGLQESLDAIEDQLALKSKEVSTLSQQIAQYKGILQQADAKQASSQKEILSLQKLAHDLEARNNSLKLESEDLKRRLSLKVASESNATEDLTLMTKENQALTRELSVVLSERDGLRQKIYEVMQSLQASENARHTVEIEKNDLLENYRGLAKEKRRLEEDLKAWTARETEELSAMQSIQQDRVELFGKLQVYTSLEERWAQERLAASQQLELLNDQLVQAQRRVESVEGDNRRMIQDAHGLKQTNAMLNERLNVLMKRASASGEANKVLTVRLASVERERDAVRALIDVERQRSADMARVAETARIEAAAKEIQLQRLRGESQHAGGAMSPSQSSL